MYFPIKALHEMVALRRHKAAEFSHRAFSILMLDFFASIRRRSMIPGSESARAIFNCQSASINIEIPGIKNLMPAPAQSTSAAPPHCFHAHTLFSLYARPTQNRVRAAFMLLGFTHTHTRGLSVRIIHKILIPHSPRN